MRFAASASAAAAGAYSSAAAARWASGLLMPAGVPSLQGRVSVGSRWETCRQAGRQAEALAQQNGYWHQHAYNQPISPRDPRKLTLQPDPSPLLQLPGTLRLQTWRGSC